MRICIIGMLLMICVPFGMVLHGQIDMPQPSPLCTLSQKVGLMDIQVIYSRPSARGRKVFGDLVLYDKLWRTGANMATKVIFSDTVYISGTVVPRGEYSLFSIPSMGDWTLILNKNSRLSGTSGYLESEDIVRVKVRPEAVPYVESFTIGINYLTNNSCYLELMWETLKVSFKIDSDVDNKVLRNIDRALTVNPSSYYQAARYYYETNRDMNIALDWINKSLEESEMFWVVRQKALIQARMGDYAGAIVTAQRSIELAKAAGNSDYVRMNLSSISEWSVK